MSNQEITRILHQIVDFHFKAYQWHTDIPESKLISAAMNGGYLLRTRIRAAIEHLDQLYQYGSAGNVRTEALSAENYHEDCEDVPSLEELPEGLE